jgi:hypothetical protein
LTRLRPRRRDKIVAGFSEIDRKFNTTREEPKNTTIKELDDQMDKTTIDGKKMSGKNSQRNFVKSFKKSHKGLR